MLPRIASGLVPLMEAAAGGNLGDMPLDIDPRTAVTVMLVSGGYPGDYEKGKVITGADATGPTIPFHAGTARDARGRLVTSGGRVIALTSYGESIPEALERSFSAAAAVDFDGKYFRRDIGRDLL